MAGNSPPRVHFSRLPVLLDVLVVSASLYVGVAVKHAQDRGVVWDGQYVILLFVFTLAWLAAAYLTGFYHPDRLTANRRVWKWVEVLALHLLLVAIFIVIRKGYYYSRLVLGYSFCTEVLGLLAAHLLYRQWHQRRPVPAIVAVGFGEPVRELLDFLRNQGGPSTRFLGFFSDQENIPIQHLPYRLGGVDAFGEYLKDARIQGIYAFVPDLTEVQSERVLALADQYLIPLNVVPDFKAFRLNHLELHYHGDLPVFHLQPHPLADTLNQALKRGFDLVFSGLFLLVVGLWLFPLLALLVRLSGRGPVFFVQLRAGRGGKPFRCLKFRTMHPHKEAFAQARPNDPRITAIGGVLRRTSLDELPQFINVLRGEMSVVGPRPHPLPLDEQYGPLLERYKVRHVVKPGLTGLAQTRGHRGETPDTRTMDHRVRMDVFYVANWSLRLDVQIILRTVQLVLMGDSRAH